MRKALLDEKRTNLFDYLNRLLGDYFYPYANQGKGKYNATDLHSKITVIFDSLAKDLETKRKDKAEMIDFVSFEICSLINEELEKRLDQSCASSYYLIDFKIFAQNVSLKIKELFDI